MAAIAALSTLTLAGCDLWFGNRHCETAGDAIAIGLLDPYTGQCQYQGGGGGGTCGDYGGPTGGAEPAPVDMALCESECTWLLEADCLAAPGCRAAYASDCPEGLDCDNTTYTYFACWATAPSGPVQGECTALDAYECSRHDDCVANHYPGTDCPAGSNCAPEPVPGTIGNFESCAPEPAPTPSCYGDVLCDSLPPDCPAGTVPGIQGDCWSGTCIAYDQCDPPLDPGACEGDVLCDSLPPECPPDSVPGILDGCWSGLCIPIDQCAPAP